MKLKVGDYAFWRKDSFPYILGGKIVKVGKRELSYPTFGKPYFSDYLIGKVEIKGYGKGLWFTPKFTLNWKDGLALLRVLDKLESIYRLERDDLYSRMYNEVMKTHPKVKSLLKR